MKDQNKNQNQDLLSSVGSLCNNRVELYSQEFFYGDGGKSYEAANKMEHDFAEQEELAELEQRVELQNQQNEIINKIKKQKMIIDDPNSSEKKVAKAKKKIAKLEEEYVRNQY